jgi:hypothetical protein
MKAQQRPWQVGPPAGGKAAARRALPLKLKLKLKPASGKPKPKPNPAAVSIIELPIGL